MNVGGYQNWAPKFLQSRDVKSVWRYIDSLTVNKGGKLLKTRLLKACYLARTYDKNADPNYRGRESDKQFYKELDDHLVDIRHIKRFLNEYSKATGMAFALALLELKEEITVHCEGRTETQHLLLRFLEEYEQALHRPLLGIRAGPFIHRHQLGNLMYRDAIDAQNRTADPRTDGLLFELTVYFRQATQKQQPARLEHGFLMPTTGKPCTKHVTKLVNKALGTDLTPENTRDRIRALAKREVGLTNWPHR